MRHNCQTQKQYDHRLRSLIQTTGDLDLAIRYGTARSTARGWLKQTRTPKPFSEKFSFCDVVSPDCGVFSISWLWHSKWANSASNEFGFPMDPGRKVSEGH